MGRIVVGTASWADPGFIDEWYPEDLPARERLGWYAEHFEAVEVNSTFYAVPAASTVARWADETPDGFTFDIKLHRLLSRHSADLKSLPEALRKPAKTTPKGRVKLDDECSPTRPRRVSAGARRRARRRAARRRARARASGAVFR